MSVISNGYNYEVDQNKKEEKDYLLKEVTNKEGGTELIEKVVNYTEIQKTNGTVDMWDTQKLREAGVNLERNTPRTNPVTRLEGVNAAVESAAAVEERIQKESKKNESK